jgi:hypothetical protein
MTKGVGAKGALPHPEHLWEGTGTPPPLLEVLRKREKIIVKP